jgi:hypothetical protein
MTITFADDKLVIVYALETIISYTRDNRYIFLAQTIRWIASILGLQEGLIIHIDNLKARSIPSKKEESNTAIDIWSTHIHPERISRIDNTGNSYSDSNSEVRSTSEDDIDNEIIDNCDAFLEERWQERKAIGRKTRQIS